MQKLNCEVNRKNKDWFHLPLSFFLEEGRYTCKINIFSSYFLQGDWIVMRINYNPDKQDRISKTIFNCQGKDGMSEFFDILISSSEGRDFEVEMKITRLTEYNEDPWIGSVYLSLKEIF